MFNNCITRVWFDEEGIRMLQIVQEENDDVFLMEKISDLDITPKGMDDEVYDLNGTTYPSWLIIV